MMFEIRFKNIRNKYFLTLPAYDYKINVNEKKKFFTQTRHTLHPFVRRDVNNDYFGNYWKQNCRNFTRSVDPWLVWKAMNETLCCTWTRLSVLEVYNIVFVNHPKYVQRTYIPNWLIRSRPEEFRAWNSDTFATMWTCASQKDYHKRPRNVCFGRARGVYRWYESRTR